MGHQPFPRALPRDNTSGSCGAHGTGRVSASRNPSTPGNRLLPACGDGDATGVEPLATAGRTEDDWLVSLVHCCSVAILRLGPRRSFTRIGRRYSLAQKGTALRTTYYEQ